jgi:hypothetical protein
MKVSAKSPSEKKPKKIPFAFVLEELAPLTPFTRPMFGCHAVYVEDRIIFILREKAAGDRDNGVWVATAPEHHPSLKKELPALRSIEVFGGGVTAWQNLPLEDQDFESAVVRACELVLAGDPRIGKVPKGRGTGGATKRKKAAKSSSKKKPAAAKTAKKRK